MPLDNARHFLETVLKDVTLAAHGLTRDTLSRVKTRLVDILPSLSPAVARKKQELTTRAIFERMLDDPAKEANGEAEAESEGNKDEDDNLQKQEHDRQSSSKSPYALPTSSLFASLKPSSRL